MRERDQKIMAGVGVRMASAIPVAGWAAAAITGTIIVLVSLTAIKDAIKASQNNVESAEEDVRSCENMLPDKKRARDDLQQKLSQNNTGKTRNREETRSA